MIRDLAQQMWVSLGMGDTPLRVTVRNGRARTRGGIDRRGKSFIQINVDHIKQAASNGIFHEYLSFRYDPDIGSVRTSSPELITRVTVAHEVAHAVQFTWLHEGITIGPDLRKPHGNAWRHIYRQLRRNFCNGKVQCG